MVRVTKLELNRTISDIMTKGNLDQLTTKKIRQLCEEKYKVDLSSRKQEIDKIVMAFVSKKSAEEENANKNGNDNNESSDEGSCDESNGGGSSCSSGSESESCSDSECCYSDYSEEESVPKNETAQIVKKPVNNAVKPTPVNNAVKPTPVNNAVKPKPVNNAVKPKPVNNAVKPKPVPKKVPVKKTSTQVPEKKVVPKQPPKKRAAESTSRAAEWTSQSAPSTSQAVAGISQAAAGASLAVASTSQAAVCNNLAVASTSRAAACNNLAVASTSRAAACNDLAVASTSQAAACNDLAVASTSQAAEGTSQPPKKQARVANRIDEARQRELDDAEIARQLQAQEWNFRDKTARTLFKDLPRKKPDKKGKKKATPFKKKCALSPALAEVLGTDELSRPDVVQKMWSVVRERKLFDPSNKQYALCDEQLKIVFGKNRVRLMGMMKYLKQHIKDKTN